MLCGLVPVGVSAEDGTLWLITQAGRGKPRELLTRIDPSGNAIDTFHPQFPLRPIEWVDYLSPAVSERRVGLLANVVSGGQAQTREGAYFVPMLPDKPGDAVHVAGLGPQWTSLAGAGAGHFVAAGDQSPLTIMKLDANGGVIWRRVLSSRLVLPEVAVSSSGKIYVVSEGTGYVMLHVIDASGRIVGSRSIAAMQGTVAVDEGGGCSLLISKRAGGENNAVFLVTFDEKLAEVSRIKTPLVAWRGRTYELASTHRGHVVIGEGPEPFQFGVQPKMLLAELDLSGRVLSEHRATSAAKPLLAPFQGGFYIVYLDSEVNGTNIEKYIY